MVLAVRYEDVVAAFRAEAERLAGVMLALGEEAFDRPTACEPWTVADLLAHVRPAIGRLWGMLEELEPAPACFSALGYYRPDARFSHETNAARIAAAQQDATAIPDGHALASDFDRTWRRQYERVVVASSRRVVRTRHGDLMVLGDVLVTRVVELGVHGLDLAAALDRAPWLTPQAAGVVAEADGGGGRRGGGRCARLGSAHVHSQGDRARAPHRRPPCQPLVRRLPCWNW
jgi:uncharacterized protein (TIGR03083 family)